MKKDITVGELWDAQTKQHIKLSAARKCPDGLSYSLIYVKRNRAGTSSPARNRKEKFVNLINSKTSTVSMFLSYTYAIFHKRFHFVLSFPCQR